MRHVFFLSLALSSLYTAYTVYTTPTALPLPSSKAPAAFTVHHDTTPYPTSHSGASAIVRSAKGKRPVPTLSLPSSATLAGRMARADRLPLYYTTLPPALSSVGSGSALPLPHYPTTPVPYADRGSVTGSRRVLPVFSPHKNGGVRYNGTDRHAPNVVHAKSK